MGNATTSQVSVYNGIAYTYDDNGNIQTRYYNPRTGRFINADAFAATGQGLLGNNMFSYCNNAVVSFSDASGQRMVCASILDRGGGSYSDAERVVKRNKDAILEAADKYGVDANVVAGCIYVEQDNNYNIIDTLTDLPFFFMDTSLGVGQVRISTALRLEELGYIEVVGNGIWKTYEIAQKLQSDDVYNINCVAAYISLHQDQWCEVHDISNNPVILGTLFNVGERQPHSTPGSNGFGDKVGACYWHMKLLLN